MPDANPPPQQSSTSPSSTQTTHSAPLDANAIPASEPPMHREPAPRRKPGRPRLGESPDLDKKRSRNTAAARKYRQKQFDRIKELEDLLADAKKETDDLKLRLARQEAESATLRGLLGMGGSGPRCSREGNTSSAS